MQCVFPVFWLLTLAILSPAAPGYLWRTSQRPSLPGRPAPRLPIPVMTPSSVGDDARRLKNETFSWLRFQRPRHLTRHRVCRSSGRRGDVHRSATALLRQPADLCSRTSAAADMCGAPDAATEPPPGSVCRERSVCPGGTSNQAMWCLILRADRAMEDSYFFRSRSRLIGQCEVAVRSFLPGRSAVRLALFARRDQTASSLPLRGRDDPGGPLA